MGVSCSSASGAENAYACPVRNTANAYYSFLFKSSFFQESDLDFRRSKKERIAERTPYCDGP
ncbi:hypothetical protein M514_08765, partial [Trichuris suis]